MEEKYKVKVLFVKSNQGKESFITAIMPYELGTNNPSTMGCYEHIGQHGYCHDEWVRIQKRAKPEEYGYLLSELESIGYGVEIINRFDMMKTYKSRRMQLLMKF